MTLNKARLMLEFLIERLTPTGERFSPACGIATPRKHWTVCCLSCLGAKRLFTFTRIETRFRAVCFKARLTLACRWYSLATNTGSHVLTPVFLITAKTR